jgi:AmmeMemoRadiSam system protein A
MDDDVKRRLLQLARSTIEAYVRQEAAPAIEGDWPALDHAGAFVTLRNSRRLRGCIGTFTPLATLPLTIQEMAVEACCDPRFVTCPVTCDELPQLRIEISVLSPLERTFEPCNLQVGRHGIYIRRDHRVGCFLPQVASEMRWDADTFLSQCCSGKADLPAYAWQDPDTEVYLFTTESFCEDELPGEPG